METHAGCLMHVTLGPRWLYWEVPRMILSRGQMCSHDLGSVDFDSVPAVCEVTLTRFMRCWQGVAGLFADFWHWGPCRCSLSLDSLWIVCVECSPPKTQLVSQQMCTSHDCMLTGMSVSCCSRLCGWFVSGSACFECCSSAHVCVLTASGTAAA